MITTRSLCLGLFSLVAIAAPACAVAPTESSHPANVRKVGQRAIVTAADATAAYQIIQDRFYDPASNYLPFKYGVDGCYGRALYMSMELAVEGIPSSSQYAIVVKGSGTVLSPLKSLSPKVYLTDPVTKAQVQWGYHVVPMLQVEGSTTKTVLDPALLAAPASFETWMQYNNPESIFGGTPRVDTPFKEGSVFAFDRTSPLGSPTHAGNAEMISSFDDMQAFKKSDIDVACRIMYTYLSCAQWGNATSLGKRPLLVSRTNELVAGLDLQGKLTDDMGATPLDCTKPVPRFVDCAAPPDADEEDFSPEFAPITAP